MSAGDGARMSFWDHLGELRGVLIRSLVALIPGLAVTTYWSRTIFDWLVRPLARVQDATPLYTFSPPEAIFLYLKITILGAIVLSSPYWIVEVIRFVSPALRDHERRMLYPAGVGGLVLFLTGIGFAYYLVMPLALEFLWEFNQFWGLEPHWRIDYYMDFALMVLLVFGVAFELPLLVTILARVGVASPAFLRQYRPHAIVLFVALSAIITPPDLITQLFLAGPLWLLYEISIVLARYVYPDQHPTLRDQPETEDQNHD